MPTLEIEDEHRIVAPRSVEELRRLIDVIDGLLMTTAVERFALAREMAERKLLDGRPMYDPQREDEIILRANQLPGGEHVAAVMRGLITVSRTMMLAMTEQDNDPV
jgi:chorismate mutase